MFISGGASAADAGSLSRVVGETPRIRGRCAIGGEDYPLRERIQPQVGGVWFGGDGPKAEPPPLVFLR